IFYLRPDPGLMTGVPILFQLHAISALVLSCSWPFTRLVHMLTAPLGCLTRPYIVYRSRCEQRRRHGPRRGRERPGGTGPTPARLRTFGPAPVPGPGRRLEARDREERS